MQALLSPPPPPRPVGHFVAAQVLRAVVCSTTRMGKKDEQQQQGKWAGGKTFENNNKIEQLRVVGLNYLPLQWEKPGCNTTVTTEGLFIFTQTTAPRGNMYGIQCGSRAVHTGAAELMVVFVCNVIVLKTISTLCGFCIFTSSLITWHICV